jgi:hypothetical protein
MFRHILVLSVCGLGAAAFASAGCSSPTPATAQAYVTSLLGPGQEKNVNDGSKCHLGNTVEWVDIGDVSHSVKDGDQQTGAGVGVSCSVTSKSASQFHFAGQASVAGQGSLTFDGDLTNDLTADQPNIHMVWQRGDTGTYTDDTCTADYRSNPNMGVAGGRIWAKITCPHALDPNQDSTCQGTAEFKFENCGQ